MKRNELIMFVKGNNINLKKYNIFVGEKSNVPYSMGCYEEAGTWYLYEVGERQNCSIIKEGNEDDVISHLYFKICGRLTLSAPEGE